MNRLEYDQTGGFPLTTNRLTDIQDMYTPLINGLGEMCGEFAIITGCKEMGNTVTNGVVQVNEEIFAFKGGIKQSTVTIFEDQQEVEFENGQRKIVVIKRYIAFGAGAKNYNWADFTRLMPLNTIQGKLDMKADQITVDNLLSRLETLEKQNAVFTAGGGMVLWNKPANQIPTGWQEVVDWRGRMPVGFDSAQGEFNALGKTGGNKTHILTGAQMPSHNHAIINASGWGVRAGSSHEVLKFGTGNNTYTTSSGGNAPFGLLNPYRVVMFIEYIG